MGAILAIRGQKIIAAAATTFLLLVGFLVYNHKSAEHPITANLRLPELKLPSYPNGNNKNVVVIDGPGRQSDAASVHAAASNATLGFSKILSIHLKHRWDKWDATVLQAYTSGLDVEFFEAVDGKEDIEKPGKIGLPPNAGKLAGGMIACYRSHANIWAEMVRTRSPPVVIIESDAGWDVNLRGIMGRANKEMIEYLHEAKSKPADAPFYSATKQDRPKDRGVEYNPDDPWQSEHWDVLALGHCDRELEDFDPENMPPARHYKDSFYTPNDKNRKVYRSKGWSCTTGYAVTHRGAAKLLLRLALEFGEPVDLIIQKMINNGDLISMMINPGPIVQWEYHTNIGMGAAANSDLARLDFKDRPYVFNHTDDGSGWDDAMKRHSVWEVSNKFEWVKYKTFALGEAWKTIMGKGAQFTMPEIPGIGNVMSIAGPKPEAPAVKDTMAAGGEAGTKPAGTRRWQSPSDSRMFMMR